MAAPWSNQMTAILESCNSIIWFIDWSSQKTSRLAKKHNVCLQLRRAISIQAEGKKLLEKHAIAPSAARLCWATAMHLNARQGERRTSLTGFIPILGDTSTGSAPIVLSFE